MQISLIKLVAKILSQLLPSDILLKIKSQELH